MGMHMVVTMIDQKIDQPYAGKVVILCVQYLYFVAKVDLALEKIEEQKYESDVK